MAISSLLSRVYNPLMDDYLQSGTTLFPPQGVYSHKQKATKIWIQHRWRLLFSQICIAAKDVHSYPC
ncbi:hypothetical protein NQZ68_025225 [Dissostichus eleginoides]|nr:hypothetical protein NQZ68_025225 [Dissostichus eleginoides]